MCQAKEVGGLRCSGHIKQNIASNNFTYNKLIIEEGKKMGDGEKMAAIEKEVALRSELATEFNQDYLAKSETVNGLENTYDGHATHLNSMLQHGATEDQVARYIVENNKEYKSIRANYENNRNRYKEILKNGNKWQIAIAKRQMVQKRNEVMAAIGPMVESAKNDARGITNHGNIQKTAFIQHHATQLDDAKKDAEKLHQQIYQKNEQKLLEHEVRKLDNYSDIVASIEKQPTRKSRVCHDRQKELFSQYRMTNEYTNDLKSKIDVATKAGKTERVLRLSSEYEGLVAARAKEQYDNIKSSKATRKRPKLAALKEEYNEARSNRDNFNQQHVEYIQESRAAA